MAATDRGERAFLVRITDTQNATWQGTVTWIDDQEVRPFRSALELLKLIDSTLTPPAEK
ncbi:MAG: hypothetical protein ACOX81_03410 [Candidatus Heteroscillospira sp.]|jgi:hypothetical protein